MSFEKGGKIVSTLGRYDALIGEDGQQIVNLHYNAAFSSFKVTRYTVTALPEVEKRPNCTQTEILLAFPTTQSGEPWVESQNVYAFLPIRDYGFKVCRSCVWI